METAERARSETQPRSFPTHILEDGFFAGMLGASLVALWYLVLDMLAGRPFFTPALLGSVLFRGVSDAAGVVVQPSIVAWYTALHFVTFLVIGIVASWLATQFERFPAVGIAIMFLFVLFESFFFFFALAIGKNLLGTLGLWTIAVANLLAAAGMAGYLWYRHPQAIRNLRKVWDEEEQ
jgi:hypothetical protein